VAADDPHWRVREHVARITAQRELGQLVDSLLPMLEYELPRVRATAVRAIGVAGEFEHVAAIEELRDDPDHAVRAAVERALEKLERRLDRDLN
jgi:HEAT repeat protein